MIAKAITDIESYLALHEQKDMLRFITCGSVDDGKSTLIGRLLHDTKTIYEDQLANLVHDSKTSGSRAGEIDLAYLVDGLQSEREQGITIDVAYRYFSTDRRKFIIADTPGHEQYTRNMATGASTAGLAIILVDARYGVQTQTRRHSFICDLLGIEHFVVAVNKMDLVDYAETAFENIRRDYLEFAAALNCKDIHFVPLSALEGENVIRPSAKTLWYTGPTLLSLLETIDIAQDETADELRFPVQYVNRPNPDFRGYCGTLSAGGLSPGQPIKVLPSGKTSNVKSILTWEGEQPAAYRGQAVTLTLDDELDISRGDLITALDTELRPCETFEADVVWMHETPMAVGQRFEIKLAHNMVHATLTHIAYQVDVNSLAKLPASQVPLNGIARCRLSVTKPMVLETYRQNKTMGGFVLIDRMTNLTVGVGMVTSALYPENIVYHPMTVGKAERAARNHQKPAILWFTGLSGAGKSTLANALEGQLFAMGFRTYLLDGDNVRHGICRDLGFSRNERSENIRRIGETAKLMLDAGLLVLVSAIAPSGTDRQTVRELVQPGEFVEVFVDAPLATCESRDPKGLYKRARRGELSEFTGVSAAYDPPANPEIRVDATLPLDACIRQVLDTLKAMGAIA